MSNVFEVHLYVSGFTQWWSLFYTCRTFGIQQEAVLQLCTPTQPCLCGVLCFQWEPPPHSGDSHKKHRRCWPVVPPAGDPDRRRDGEEDQRPGQKHEVSELISFNILIYWNRGFVANKTVYRLFELLNMFQLFYWRSSPVCFSGEWGDWRTRHRPGRRGSIHAAAAAPFPPHTPTRTVLSWLRSDSLTVSQHHQQRRPSITRRVSFLLGPPVLHVAFYSCYYWYFVVLDETPPPPVETNLPPSCFPPRPSAWRSSSLSLTTDSLFLTRGRNITTTTTSLR